MADMTEDRTKLQWPRLATAIRAAREARGLTQEALAALAGVAEGSVQNLESGKPRNRMPQTLSKIEPHLGWDAGSGRLILDGGDPIPASGTPAGSHGDAEAGILRRKLPLRIVNELESDDPLLDSAVIQLPGANGARMTVVVHGSPGATPQEIQEALLAWRRTEESLRRLPDDDGDDGDEPRAANGS
jgi:transcriptional regulator with XRE-family HTH domain